MANLENLKLIRSTEEAREKGKLGGIKSGETRRRKRTLREIAEAFGSAESQTTPGLTNDEEIMLAQYREAKKGNTTAAAFLRDTMGQKPHDLIETPDIHVKPLVDLTKRNKNGSNDSAK